MKFENNGTEPVYFYVWEGEYTPGRRYVFSTSEVAPGAHGEVFMPETKAESYTVLVWVDRLKKDVAAAKGGADSLFTFGLTSFG